MIAPPEDLTVPRPGSRTTHTLASAYLRRLLGDLRSLPAERFVPDAAAALERVRAAVERELEGPGKGAVYSTLRSPTCSALLRCLTVELGSAGSGPRAHALLGELCAVLALGLALAERLPAPGLRLGVGPGDLPCPAGGFALRLREPSWITFESGRLALPDQVVELASVARGSQGVAGTCLRPYHPIVDGVLLGTVDNNPLRELEAHPDKHGNPIDLGGREPTDWVRALREAVELVDRHLPDLGAELRLLLQLVVPVGWDAERHLSASYAEAIGTIYLSLHPDPLTLVEAVIHELSHNKLNLLAALDPVLENDPSERYASPVRPDPRPLWGVLLAVHAFVPVAVLYRQLRAAGDRRALGPAATRRFASVVEGNRDGLRTLLAHARPTVAGRALLAELERWDRQFAAEGAD